MVDPALMPLTSGVAERTSKIALALAFLLCCLHGWAVLASKYCAYAQCCCQVALADQQRLTWGQRLCPLCFATGARGGTYDGGGAGPEEVSLGLQFAAGGP